MTDPAVRMRLYCHGLGDCNLVGLPRSDGSTFWILIDCGIHSSAAKGAERVRAVVANIAALTSRLDVIVGTHEHWDHLSGFLQAAGQFAGIDIGEVWFSWAENPSDPDARRFDRYKANSAAALASASLRLHESGSAQLAELADGIDSVLGFVFGAAGERVRDARERLRGLGRVRHLSPGDIAPLPPDVTGLRICVLGPPRDRKLLGIEDSPADTYGLDLGTAGTMPFANGIAVNEGRMRVDDDPGSPFDGQEGVPLAGLLRGEWGNVEGGAAQFIYERYLAPEASGADQQWRRIDGDWLAAGADLAIQLDSRTNNSSLVLTFEMIESGQVLLFAADALVGNWRSWPSVTFPPRTPESASVTGSDLVGRTVFYKVGHHGSGNATLAADGLERMDGTQLTAFNPTDESLAGRVGWRDFPAPKLTQRLRERTSGRYIQSDADWVHDRTKPMPVRPGGALRSIVVGDDPDAPYVDLLIGGSPA